MFHKAKMRAIRNMLFISLLLVLLAVLLFCMGDLIPLVVLVLIAAAFFPIYGGGKLWKRNLVAYCKKTDNPEDTIAELEAFADSTPDTGLLKISDRWLLVTGSSMLQVLDTPHVIWAYQHVITHKFYGLIPLYKSHALGLAFDNGKSVTISGPKAKVEAALDGLYRQTDHIMIGFDPQLAQMFQYKDYQGLLDAAKQIRSSSAQRTEA